MPKEGEVKQETCRICGKTTSCRYIGEHKVGAFKSIPGWYCADHEAMLVTMGIELVNLDPKDLPK